MPLQRLTTAIHTYSTIIFSIYGTLHVLHHFLAATVFDPEWHHEIQFHYMPRSIIGEKILILTPAFLSFGSGWTLLVSNRRQLFKAIQETGVLLVPSSVLKSIGGVKRSTLHVIQKGGVGELAKFRRIQYISALFLGACMAAHLPAVMLLRFAFNRGEAVNVYAAMDEAHNSSSPAFLRYVFLMYYGVLVSSFFVHGACGFAWWRIKKSSSRVVTSSDEKDHSSTSASRNATIKWYTDKVLMPSIFISIAIGAVTVGGLFLKTNEEITKPHFPKIKLGF